MEDDIKYLPLMNERRLTLFDGKRKYLYLTFCLFRCLGKFQWLGLGFNRYPHGGNYDSYLGLTLFSRHLTVGIHRGTYDQSVDTGGCE